MMWSSFCQYAVAIYNFDGKCKNGLSFEIGDKVYISEKCGGWYFGYMTNNPTNKGIFPCGYVHLKKDITANANNQHFPLINDDETIKEVNEVLREWNIIFKQYYLAQRAELKLLLDLMHKLISQRQQLISGTLTQDRIQSIKEELIVNIDCGNKKLGLDLVPRTKCNQVDPDSMSIVELYKIHQKSHEKSKRAVTSLRLSTPPSSLSNLQPKSNVSHLYLQQVNFGCNIGEEAEIRYTLYNASSSSQLSECFVVHVNKNGWPIPEDKTASVLFSNVEVDNPELDVYLVAHVYRIGSLRETDSKKISTSRYKRPFGCAVFGLGKINPSTGACESIQEFSMKVYSCNENEFHLLQENIIKKQSSKYNASSAQNNPGIVVELKIYKGDVESIQVYDPVRFLNINIAKKLGVSDIVMPGDLRNDLYLTLVKGDFEKGSKTAGKNIEIRIMVLDSSGELINNCISYGSGLPMVTHYNAAVFYHNNSPRWNETIKLAVPIDKFYGSHVRLEFRHCSTRDKNEKKIFGFSFIKLVLCDGTTTHNGFHELLVYRCDDYSKLKDVNHYCNMASSPTDMCQSITNPSFKCNERESVVLETLLCSTKLTQNSDLLSILRWREDPAEITSKLQALQNVDGQEIVKYLQDILDVFFNLFSAKEEMKLTSTSLVFQSLVDIFFLVETNQFCHFRPVLDAYISNHFSASLVYRDLIICLHDILESVPTTDEQGLFQRCFKVLEYIFKCIVQSRSLLSRSTNDQGRQEFQALLQQVFDSMARLLNYQHDLLIETQKILLRSLAQCMCQLQRVLPGPELCHVVVQLVNVIPMRKNNALAKDKLEFILGIIGSNIFTDIVFTDSRSILLPMCMTQLKYHFLVTSDLKLCCSILTSILCNFHSESHRSQSKHVSKSQHQSRNSFQITDDLHVVIVSLFDVLLDVVSELECLHKQSGSLISCLICILGLMTPAHYVNLVLFYKENLNLREFLLHIFATFQRLIKKVSFPTDWLVMKMETNSVILKATQHLSKCLIQDFLSNEDFDQMLWSDYFSFTISFLTQNCLQLENFTNAKHKRIFSRYGDLRIRVGYEIYTMWQNLGDHKFDFVPAMVGPFLEVTMVPLSELRETTLPIFFDMIECEYSNRGSFKQVESEMISRLDVLINEHKGDDEYRQLFTTMFLFSSSPTLCEMNVCIVQYLLPFYMLTKLSSNLLTQVNYNIVS